MTKKKDINDLVFVSFFIGVVIGSFLFYALWSLGDFEVVHSTALDAGCQQIYGQSYKFFEVSYGSIFCERPTLEEIKRTGFVLKGEYT